MIAFVDVETTGIDPNKGDLLEVALVIVDDDLNELATKSVIVNPITPLSIEQWRANLDPFIQEMHSKNGLLDAIVAGEGVRLHEAQEMLINFAREQAADRLIETARESVVLAQEIPTDKVLKIAESIAASLKSTPMGGSSVAFDRGWLRVHMPQLDDLFLHRSVDASSDMELARRWAPEIFKAGPRSKKLHRALPDARESVALLQYYRQSGFIGGAVAEFVEVPEPAAAVEPWTKEELDDEIRDAVGNATLALHEENRQRVRERERMGEQVVLLEKEIVRLRGLGRGRERLPDERDSKTKKFDMISFDGGGHDVRAYAIVGLYSDGRPGEIFLTLDKEAGSVAKGLADACATMASIALQHGAPIETIVSKIVGTRFDPGRAVDGDGASREVGSILDMVGRWLKKEFVKEG